MLRRSFLCRLAGMLGGLVGLGVEGVMADVSVPCPDCGKPAIPRRRYKNATEYACTQCGRELPLGAFIFTLKDNDPRCYAFFPLDIEKMFRSDIPFRPLGPESVVEAK
jgi:predicted RNA-binding Zn-ribbon protein involved in translation (DUF1610 family)